MGFYAAASIITLDICTETSDDLIALQKSATICVSNIEKKYKDKVSTNELNLMKSCFYGRNNICGPQNEFRFLKGDIVLLRQIINFVRKQTLIMENNVENYDFSFFKMPTNFQSKKIKSVIALPFGTAFTDSYDKNMADAPLRLSTSCSSNSVEYVSTDFESKDISVMTDVLQKRCFEFLKSSLEYTIENISDQNLKRNEKCNMVRLVHSMIVIKTDNMNTWLTTKSEKDLKFNVICYCNKNFDDVTTAKKKDVSYDASGYFRFKISLKRLILEILISSKDQNEENIQTSFEQAFSSHSSQKSCWLANYLRHVKTHKNKTAFKGNFKL